MRAHALISVGLAEKADVIISEWMGYFLIYESMLSTVVTARERWMKPGGQVCRPRPHYYEDKLTCIVPQVFPQRARIYLAPLTNPNKWTKKIEYWNDVYGECTHHTPSLRARVLIGAV